MRRHPRESGSGKSLTCRASWGFWGRVFRLRRGALPGKEPMTARRRNSGGCAIGDLHDPPNP